MKNNKSGFTLTEVVIASAVLAITAGAIFTSLGWSRVVIFQNRCRQEATQYAFDTLWSTFNMRWEELRNFSILTAPTVVDVHSNTLLSAYNGEVATAIYDEGDYFAIEVEVTWDSSGGAFGLTNTVETLRIRRYESDRGLD
jgi:prepilin-type N-terminal cleavage/methylation domain-containing protein